MFGNSSEVRNSAGFKTDPIKRRRSNARAVGPSKHCSRRRQVFSVDEFIDYVSGTYNRLSGDQQVDVDNNAHQPTRKSVCAASRVGLQTTIRKLRSACCHIGSKSSGRGRHRPRSVEGDLVAVREVARRRAADGVAVPGLEAPGLASRHGHEPSGLRDLRVVDRKRDLTGGTSVLDLARANVAADRTTKAEVALATTGVRNGTLGLRRQEEAEGVGRQSAGLEDQVVRGNVVGTGSAHRGADAGRVDVGRAVVHARGDRTAAADPSVPDAGREDVPSEGRVRRGAQVQRDDAIGAHEVLVGTVSVRVVVIHLGAGGEVVTHKRDPSGTGRKRERRDERDHSLPVLTKADTRAIILGHEGPGRRVILVPGVGGRAGVDLKADRGGARRVREEVVHRDRGRQRDVEVDRSASSTTVTGNEEGLRAVRAAGGRGGRGGLLGNVNLTEAGATRESCDPSVVGGAGDNAAGGHRALEAAGVVVALDQVEGRAGPIIDLKRGVVRRAAEREDEVVRVGSGDAVPDVRAAAAGAAEGEEPFVDRRGGVEGGQGADREANRVGAVIVRCLGGRSTCGHDRGSDRHRCFLEHVGKQKEY